MEGVLMRRSIAAVVFVALLARSAIAAQKTPFATVTSNDGTQYSFYKTSSPITASNASATCAAAGGTLASLASTDQVLSTLWSPSVVEAAAEETALIWTGLKITWPTASTNSHRRMLRAHHHRQAGGQHDSFAADVSSHNPNNNNKNDEDINALTLLQSLAAEMDSSTDFVVPTHTHDGRRRLPQLVRLWLFQQHNSASTSASTSASARRALLARDGMSPYLDDAVLSWADGADTSFVLSNPSNMGFLACNRKKMAECCGAVFDIGPDPYPGADFPTVFFYPCGAEKVSGATPPAGFVCAAGPPVAALPKPTKAQSPSPAPAPTSAPKKCNPGSAPATKPGPNPCVKCKANMFSVDGSKCKSCPAGTKSVKGASACK